MLPRLWLQPSSGVEWALVALLTLASAAAFLFARSAAKEQGLRKLAALLAGYLAGTIALLLALHATLSTSPIFVSSYGVMLAASVLVAWSVEVPRLRSIGTPWSLVFAMILGCLVLGVAGSRLANVIADWLGAATAESFVRRVVSRSGGLGVFGAFVVDSAFLWILFRAFPGQSLARALDASAVPIGINIGLGRIGCLLGGCCFGAPAHHDGLFTISSHAFVPGSPAAAAYASQPAMPVWATQPMEAAVVLAITAGCEVAYHRRARLGLQNGSVIAIGAALYGASRALLELVRADSAREWGPLTVWQVLGAALSLGAMAWLLVAHRAGLRPQAA